MAVLDSNAITACSDHQDKLWSVLFAFLSHGYILSRSLQGLFFLVRAGEMTQPSGVGGGGGGGGGGSVLIDGGRMETRARLVQRANRTRC